MPLRMIDYAGFSYAYIIMLLNGDRCTVLVYSGTFDHFELTRLLMHHCEHTITSMSTNDGVYWHWAGTQDTLRTVIGTGLFCSCAYCFKRKALCMSQKVRNVTISDIARNGVTRNIGNAATGPCAQRCLKRTTIWLAVCPIMKKSFTALCRLTTISCGNTF